MEQENMELFTVQQFALQVGKTSQAIYQQLKGRLKSYVTKGEGGQVLIRAEALKLYKDKQTSKPATVDKDIQALQSEANSLKAENEGLRARIENLELHIEELNEELKAAEDTNTAHEAEITKLTMERDNLREQLARELEVSRERLARAEGAEALNKELIVRFPPQLPAAGEGGGLFGWFKRRKGGQTT